MPAGHFAHFVRVSAKTQAPYPLTLPHQEGGARFQIRIVISEQRERSSPRHGLRSERVAGFFVFREIEAHPLLVGMNAQAHPKIHRL